MSKIYAQKFPIVWEASGSLAATGSLSGSLWCSGYALAVGLVRSDAGSSFQIQQSADAGQNWDLISDYPITACAASAISVSISGNAVKARLATGAAAASALRGLILLRPL